MEKITFNKVLFDHSESGFLRLALLNTVTNKGMFFDLNSFYYRDFSKHPLPADMSELKYSPCAEIKPFFIDSVKGSLDVCFIKMSNDDIFQIFFMADGSKNQLLTICDEKSKLISTPMGISSYDATYKNFIEEEDPEIAVWDNDSDK